MGWFFIFYFFSFIFSFNLWNPKILNEFTFLVLDRLRFFHLIICGWIIHGDGLILFISLYSRWAVFFALEGYHAEDGKFIFILFDWIDAYKLVEVLDFLIIG